MLRVLHFSRPLREVGICIPSMGRGLGLLALPFTRRQPHSSRFPRMGTTNPDGFARRSLTRSGAHRILLSAPRWPRLRLCLSIIGANYRARPWDFGYSEPHVTSNLDSKIQRADHRQGGGGVR